MFSTVFGLRAAPATQPTSGALQTALLPSSMTLGSHSAVWIESSLASARQHRTPDPGGAAFLCQHAGAGDECCSGRRDVVQ